MNEPIRDTQRLKQMLEDATAADSAAAGRAASAGHSGLEPCDAETASLREAWLAFEQLVRAADASLPAMPDFAPSLAPPPRRRRWIGLLAAAAAALLVAVALEWRIGGDGKQGNGSRGVPPVAGNPVVPPVKDDLQTAPGAAVAGSDKTTNKQPKAGTASPSTWEDPLESQIALVSQQVNSVRQSWRHRVDDVDLVQYRIDEVSNALQNDKL